MANDRVFAMSFAGVYPHYVKKAETKGRAKEELDEVLISDRALTLKAFGAEKIDGLSH